MPQRTYFKRFRVLVSTHQPDYFIPREVAQNDPHAAEQQSGVRWRIEQFHREFNQLTGVESCQCRKGRSQRNYIALAAVVWVRLKQVAYETKTTIYHLKQGLLDACMSREMDTPTIRFA